MYVCVEMDVWLSIPFHTFPYISIHPTMSVRCEAKTSLGKRCKLYCANKVCHFHMLVSESYDDDYAGLYSQNHNDSINALKKLQYVNDNEIEKIVNSPIMARIIECLYSHDSDIQLYACRVLTNFNGSQIEEVNKYIFTKQIYKRLVSTSFNIIYGYEMNVQSYWCLANFVGSNSMYTKAVLDYDAIIPYNAVTLIAITDVCQELRNAIMQLLHNMSLHLELKDASSIMTQIANVPLSIVRASNDAFVQNYMKCILHLLTKTHKLELSLVPFIIERFNSSDNRLGIHIISNICEMKNTFDEIEALVNNDILYHLQQKITNTSVNGGCKQELLHILSNLMCEPVAIHQIMKMPKLFYVLIKLMNEKDYTYDITWIIGNLCAYCAPEHLNLLIWSNVFETLVDHIPSCKSKSNSKSRVEHRVEIQEYLDSFNQKQYDIVFWGAQEKPILDDKKYITKCLLILESLENSIKKNKEQVLNVLRYTDLQKKLELLSNHSCNKIHAHSNLLLRYLM